MNARCPCTPPSTVETFDEEISAEACSGKEMVGLLRKMRISLAFSQRVRSHFVCGSHEISLVPSLHRASTDTLIMCMNNQGTAGQKYAKLIHQNCVSLVLQITDVPITMQICSS